METMWTPWRMGYIVGEKGPGCLLCQKHQDPLEKDRENYILHRGTTCYLLLNLFPYSNGHLMIAPYRHVASIELLDRESLGEMISLASASVAALKKALAPDGFNLGMNIGHVAGAGIAEHLHLHVVPRWHGDVNFMSVLADTRLIPEALGDTYQRLVQVFAPPSDR